MTSVMPSVIMWLFLTGAMWQGAHWLALAFATAVVGFYRLYVVMMNRLYNPIPIPTTIPTSPPVIEEEP